MKQLTFAQIMDPLKRRYGVSSVFSDFLTLLICAFSHGQREEEYLNTIRRYEKPEAYRISEALGVDIPVMLTPHSGDIDPSDFRFRNDRYVTKLHFSS